MNPQCAYTKMYQLLEGVEQCDHELNRLSLINRPSVEERACLDSLKEIMDEIIIVDTGSTDDTKKIAAEYTPYLDIIVTNFT